MSVYKIYGSAPGGANSNSVANIDIQLDGVIEAIAMDIAGIGMDALNDICSAEVSFLSLATFQANDSRGSLLLHSLVQNFLTSGGGVGSSSLSVSGISEPVNAGERIHLHTRTSTGVTADVTAYLFVRDGVGEKGRPSRRRR